MNRSRWWALLSVMFVLLLMTPLLALAQHTGGSFGSRRWGSGSSSSRSSSSSSWSRGSSSRSSSWGTSPRPSGTYYGGSGSSGNSYGSYSGKGGGGALGGLCVCIVVLIILGVIVLAARKKGGGSYAQFGATSPGPMGPMGGYGGVTETFSVGALAIAFDATARASIQAELDAVAQQMSSSGGGLDVAARATGELLSRYLAAAYFVHHALSEGQTMQGVQTQFEQAVNTERGRFMIETVRGEQGGVRRVEGPKLNARVEEGGGFVAVTLIVARRGNLTGFVNVTDRATLQQSLMALLSGGADIQALEVVWVPSNPNDVMSSAEMAVVFPSFKPLAPDAVVGRRACAHCKAVFAAELGTCPSCGAPAA